MKKFLVFKDGQEVHHADYNEAETGHKHVAENFPGDEHKVFNYHCKDKQPAEVAEYLKSFQSPAASEEPIKNKKNKKES